MRTISVLFLGFSFVLSGVAQDATQQPLPSAPSATKYPPKPASPPASTTPTPAQAPAQTNPPATTTAPARSGDTTAAQQTTPADKPPNPTGNLGTLGNAPQ